MQFTHSDLFELHIACLTPFWFVYLYDVLDNLAKVTQGGQTRFFAYDSLSRLIRARNPEQDINPNLAPAFTDPVTGNSQWSVKYVYDPNSNLSTKTDPRNIITTYTYDELNRVTGRSYSGDTQGTPAVAYKYDGQSLPAGFPAAFNRGFATGRLVAVTYGGTSAGTYTGYDQLGRVTSSYQQTEGQNYGFTYGYDLAGELISQTYPSGRVMQTDYDSAARITGVKRQGTEMYYAGGPAGSNRIQYSAHGAVKAMQLGNGRWERTSFNSRLQPTQIALDSNTANVNTLGLTYGYGTTTNNGNVMSQSITVAGSGGLSILLAQQSYTYDALNRLETATEIGGLGWMQTYDYDRWGNRAVRSTSTYIPNARQTPISNSPTDLQTLFNQGTNRITASADYVYDPAGNLTTMPNKVVGLPADTMAYDAENRQIKFNSTTQNYFYDGDGRRVKKIVGNDTTLFVYNVAGQLIAEYTSGTPAAGDTSYLTTDHLGSTRVVTDSGGNVKARYDYVPFGEEIGSNIGARTVAMDMWGAGLHARSSPQKKEIMNRAWTTSERDTIRVRREDLPASMP